MGKKAELFVQSVKQAGGLMVMAVRYSGKEPDKRTGASREEYALPFEGAWTVVNGGVVKETSHSWDVLTQRYAYDFVILDDEGRSCRPDADPADPASYYCHGLPILAPADGVVVEAGASCPNATIWLDGKVHFGGGDIRGNYVLVEHAHGEFSCLCHLMPGGVSVEVGQEVRRGQQVGLCGSSGCSSEPTCTSISSRGRASTPRPACRCGSRASRPLPRRTTRRPIPVRCRRGPTATSRRSSRAACAWSFRAKGSRPGCPPDQSQKACAASRISAAGRRVASAMSVPDSSRKRLTRWYPHA